VRNEVERLLAIGIREDRRRSEIRALLTSPQMVGYG